ncbi:MAG: hypothetical protein QM811_27985 [Pirellulales bacterium]
MTAAQEVGRHQLAGTIVAGGKVGPRCGYEQRRGTIVLRDPTNRTMLPPGRFQTGYRGEPVVLRTLLRSIGSTFAHFGLSPPDAKNGPFELYHGDLLELGRGEVWLPVVV